MLGMLSAEGAIFLKLKLFARVFLVLHGIVVSLLAFLASESDFNSCICSHLRHLLFVLLRFCLFAKRTKNAGQPFERMPGVRNTGAELAPMNILRPRLWHASLLQPNLRTAQVE